MLISKCSTVLELKLLCSQHIHTYVTRKSDLKAVVARGRIPCVQHKKSGCHMADLGHVEVHLDAIPSKQFPAQRRALATPEGVEGLRRTADIDAKMSGPPPKLQATSKCHLCNVELDERHAPVRGTSG